jgi:hypothetical protein
LLIGGRGWREVSLDFEAGGIGAVFEEVDSGVGGEGLELGFSPRGFDSEVLGAAEDSGFVAGLQAGEPRHGGGHAIGLQDALQGNQRWPWEVVCGVAVALFGTPAMHEIGFQFLKQAGDEAAFPAVASEHFHREFPAGQQVKGLIPSTEREGRGDLFGAGDPVEIVVYGVSFQFTGQRGQPGGVVARWPTLESRKCVDREISQQCDAHGVGRTRLDPPNCPP